MDIPVPHGRVGGGRLLGLHLGQSSTAFGGAEHFPAAAAEHLVDIPVPRGGRVLHPASSSSGLPGTANQGFCRTFLRGKKRDVGSALGSAGGFLHGCSWRCVDAVPWWLVETSGLGPRSLAAWVKAGTGPSSCVSLRLLLEEFRRVFLSFVLAQFALGIWYIISFATGSYCSAHLGIAEEYGNLDFSGDVYFRWCNALCAPEDALPRAASTVYFNLDDDEGVLAARPDRLHEATGPGSAAHRGAERRRPHVSVSRCA